MTLFSLSGAQPTLDEGAWAAPSAALIGDVRLGKRASVWFGAILRGDNTPLVLGDDTNFQDGAIGHSDSDFPLVIGARVTVGHQAIVHGCTVADDVLIGMGAKILNGAVIPSQCLIGAGALVTEGKSFEPGMLIIGSPAKAVRALSDEEKATIRASAELYSEKGRAYASLCSPLK